MNGKRLAPKRTQARKFRRNGGFGIVEILVAILLSALITGLLMNALAQLLRVTSFNRNQSYASTIAQEMVESAKSLDYAYLESVVQPEKPVLLYQTSIAQPSRSPLSNSPALLDYQNKDWPGVSESSEFNGIALCEVSSAGIPVDQTGKPEAIRVTAKVKWADSQNQSSQIAPREITYSTLVTSAGLNKWSQ